MATGSKTMNNSFFYSMIMHEERMSDDLKVICRVFHEAAPVVKVSTINFRYALSLKYRKTTERSPQQTMRRSKSSESSLFDSIQYCPSPSHVLQASK